MIKSNGTKPKRMLPIAMISPGILVIRPAAGNSGKRPMCNLIIAKDTTMEGTLNLMVIKARIILYTITRLFGNSCGIEKIHIEDIVKLCENNIGNKFLTPNKKIKVLVKNHQIYFISQI